jgi:hypothetical protein
LEEKDFQFLFFFFLFDLLFVFSYQFLQNCGKQSLVFSQYAVH